MNIGQIESAYRKHEHTPCLITDRLVQAGYQQTGGGYIDRAKATGMTVDYHTAQPSQWWHLMTYCKSRKPTFTRNIVCGELIFWMAEVSGLVPVNDLNTLVDNISSVKDDPCRTNSYKKRACIHASYSLEKHDTRGSNED